MGKDLRRELARVTAEQRAARNASPVHRRARTTAHRCGHDRCRPPDIECGGLRRRQREPRPALRGDVRVAAMRRPGGPIPLPGRARAGVGGRSGRDWGAILVPTERAAGGAGPLGLRAASYVAADVVAGPEFSCETLGSDLTACVAEGDGVRAYDLRKGCEGTPRCREHGTLARLVEPWMTPRRALGGAVARLGTNTAWPPTRVAVDDKCGCGDLMVPECAAGGCDWSPDRGTRVVSPVSIKFTTTGDVAGLGSASASTVLKVAASRRRRPWRVQ